MNAVVAAAAFALVAAGATVCFAAPPSSGSPTREGDAASSTPPATTRGANGGDATSPPPGSSGPGASGASFDGAPPAEGGPDGASSRGEEGPTRERSPLAVLGRPDRAESVSRLDALGFELQDDGSYLLVDPKGRFTAQVNPDGTLLFADAWRRVDRFKAGRGRCCALPPHPLVNANPLRGMPVRGPLEWAMRAVGRDLYGRDKNDLLEATFDLRVAMAAAAAIEAIDAALTQLPADLRKTGHILAKDPKELRRVIFARWDECLESLPPVPGELPSGVFLEVDAHRVDRARDARRIIEAYVRDTLPKGSAHAYPPAELDALNAARTSEQPFDPYTIPP